jgi:hypothetical protein
MRGENFVAHLVGLGGTTVCRGTPVAHYCSSGIFPQSPLQLAVMGVAAYFCRYPASRGISRAVPKVSESSTGGAARAAQLTRWPRLVFIISHIKIVYRRSPFSLTAHRSIGTPHSPRVPDKRTFTVPRMTHHITSYSNPIATFLIHDHTRVSSSPTNLAYDSRDPKRVMKISLLYS